MKHTKSLLFTAPVWAAALVLSGSAWAQTPSSPKNSTTPVSSAPALNNPNGVSANADAVAVSDTTSATMDSSTKLKWSDKRFVTKVAEGAQLEIALADLAAQRTSNAEIRAFAEKVSAQHVALSRQLAALAEKKGLSSEIAEYAPHEGALAMVAVSGNLPSSGESIAVATTAPHYQPGTSNFDETQARKTADGKVVASQSSLANNNLSVAVDAPKNRPGTSNFDETQSQKQPVNSTAARPVAPITPLSTASDVAVAVAPPKNQPGTTNYDETQSQKQSVSGSMASSPRIATADTIAADRSTGFGVAGAPTGSLTPTASSEWNDPTKDRHYTRLAAKSGTEFDQAFISATRAAHEDAAEMFAKKSENAKDADVKAFAASSLGAIQQNLGEAQRLSTQFKTEP